jgi:hypothetical protein
MFARGEAILNLIGIIWFRRSKLTPHNATIIFKPLAMIVA